MAAEIYCNIRQYTISYCNEVCAVSEHFIFYLNIVASPN